VPTHEVQMLGVPLGSDEFVGKMVSGRLLTTSTKVMAKLVEFDDPQAAMYILRLSYGIVRANHFMRTTPLAQWSEVAAKFDRVFAMRWLRFSVPLFPAIRTFKHAFPPRLEASAFDASQITLTELSLQVGMNLCALPWRSGMRSPPAARSMSHRS